MILPDGKNKKYVDMVSGLYILYVILNPILSFDKSLAISDIKLAITGVSTGSYVSQEDMSRRYILSIENDLKSKIEELGYKPDYIQFYITPDYSTIAKIEVRMKIGTEYDEGKIIDLVLNNFKIDRKDVFVL